MNKADYIKTEMFKIIKGAFSPSVLFSDIPKYWYLYNIIPAATFFFFFLQAGLDRFALKTISGGMVVLLCFLGIIFGAAFNFLESGVIKLLCKITHKEADYKKLNGAVCMTYVFPLIINFLGLIFKLIFQMNTSLAFGLCGILISFVFLYEIFISLEIGGIKNRKISSVFGVSVIMMIGLGLMSFLMMI